MFSGLVHRVRQAFSLDPAMGLGERLWRFLPDRCQVVGCPRTGVRGNENRWGELVVCDDCDARLRVWHR